MEVSEICMGFEFVVGLGDPLPEIIVSMSFYEIHYTASFCLPCTHIKKFPTSLCFRGTPVSVTSPFFHLHNSSSMDWRVLALAEL